ncbi:MAG: MBL fold metallo-hydrolase [Phycisphaeraceae bacterium]
MHIQTFTLGEWMTNCFVLHEERPAVQGQRRPCWIIDAGFQPEAMTAYIKRNDLEPKAVLLTHGHLDHIAGLIALRMYWPDLPILIHESEESFLVDPLLNLSVVLEEPIIVPAATGFLKHGQEMTIAGKKCKLRHTPGHSPGGITFYFPDERLAIVGDTLLAGGVGRADFPTSDHDLLFKSIRDQLLTLPDDTRILPGHGPQSTIGQERKFNPFL